MSVQFAPQGTSFGGNLGSSVGEGINRIIERKIKDLQTAEEKKKGRAVYEEAGLPPWLNDLDEKTRLEIIKNYEMLPPEQKQQVAQAMNNVGLEGEELDEGQPAQQVGPAPIPYAPTAEGQEAYKSTIPGMNNLMQAGAGQSRDMGTYGGPQSLLSEGHGTSGVPSPSSQPYESGQGLPGSGFTDKAGRRFVRREKEGKTREDELFKQQPKIQKLNAEFNNQIAEEVPVSEQIIKKAQELLALEESGETPENSFTRGYAQYAPGFLNAYNTYNAKANEIAALKSQKTGRPSVFMTQLQQSTKPNTGQSKSERIGLLNDLINDAQPIVDLQRAREEVINEHGGFEPLNLKNLSTQRAIDNKLQEIDPSDYKDKTVIELFGKKFIKRNNEFVPSGKAR